MLWVFRVERRDFKMVLTKEEEKEAGERRRRAFEKHKQDLAKDGWRYGGFEEIDRKLKEKYNLEFRISYWWRMSKILQFCPTCYKDREHIQIEYVGGIDRDPNDTIPSRKYICEKCGSYSVS
jgi:hypothetical protein